MIDTPNLWAVRSMRGASNNTLLNWAKQNNNQTWAQMLVFYRLNVYLLFILAFFCFMWA
jgi:hypothetical protein